MIIKNIFQGTLVIQKAYYMANNEYYIIFFVLLKYFNIFAAF